MKGEHKSTGDENDMRAGFYDPKKGWTYWYCYISRAGVRKAIKKQSHRTDRQVGKRRIREELDQ